MGSRSREALDAAGRVLARRGDGIYRRDEYAKLGATAILDLPSGARLESGIVGQYIDDGMNYTFLINFTWGQAFKIDFLEPRQE